MQSTYDPRQIKNIVPGKAYDNPALKQLFGLPQNWNWLEAKIDKKLDAGLKDVSPITHLTKDDPPVFVLHNAAANKDGNIHPKRAIHRPGKVPEKTLRNQITAVAVRPRSTANPSRSPRALAPRYSSPNRQSRSI